MFFDKFNFDALKIKKLVSWSKLLYLGRVPEFIPVGSRINTKLE